MPPVLPAARKMLLQGSPVCSWISMLPSFSPPFVFLSFWSRSLNNEVLLIRLWDNTEGHLLIFLATVSMAEPVQVLNVIFFPGKCIWCLLNIFILRILIHYHADFKRSRVLLTVRWILKIEQLNFFDKDTGVYWLSELESTSTTPVYPVLSG